MNLSCKDIDDRLKGRVCRKSHPNTILTGKPVIYHCGGDGGEEPPVLIPNTEVKLDNAQSTWLDTAWEDR